MSHALFFLLLVACAGPSRSVSVELQDAIAACQRPAREAVAAYGPLAFSSSARRAGQAAFERCMIRRGWVLKDGD